jgi:hypothetical protein
MRKSSKKPASFSALFAGITDAATAATAAPATDKAAAAAALSEMHTAARAVAKTLYSGSSLAVRHGNPKLAKIIENTKTPKQHTDGINDRDRSYLRTLRTTYAAYVNTVTGEFDPVISKLDAGVCSHLSQHGLTRINDAGNGIMLTSAGLKQLATA